MVNPLNFSATLRQFKGTSVPLFVQKSDGQASSLTYQCLDECILGVAMAYDEYGMIKSVRLGAGSWYAAWQELKAQTHFTWK